MPITSSGSSDRGQPHQIMSHRDCLTNRPTTQRIIRRAAALLLLIWLVSGYSTCWAGCTLESVDLGPSQSGSINVMVRTHGNPELTLESHPDKLVMYLRGCSAPPGSHSIPGDGVLVKKVRWNYKPEPAAVWVVIEHQVGVTSRLEGPTDGQIIVVLSGPETSQNGSEQAQYVGRQSKIPAAIKGRMAKYSWQAQCPVDPDQLAYLKVTHWGFDGKTHQGELIVNQKVSDEVMEIFKELFDQGFPIEKIRLIEEYQGSDDASMADNNSSAFNCRLAKGSQDKYSTHSHGLAIDINPLMNPYVKNNQVFPQGGARYLDRTAKIKGMIVKGGPCYNAFTKRGWQWGGDWKSLKDYQHFEKP